MLTAILSIKKGRLRKLFGVISAAWLSFKRLGRRGIAGALAVFIVGTSLPIFLFAQHASASTMGPNKPITGSSSPGVGSVGWASPGNVVAQDGIYASATLSSGSISNYLEATNFGFTIPSNATINGIQADVYRYSPGASDQTAEDDVVELIQSGNTPSGSNLATTTAWPTSNTMTSYGNSSQLWGLSWTPAQLNSTSFGVALAAQNVHSGGKSNSLSVYVDFVQVTVTYTIPVSYNQAGYRWMENTNPAGYPYSEQISSGSDQANAVAVDSANGYMYTVGYDSNGSGNNYEWRIEKRLLSDGSLVSTFGTNGAISEHISSASDTANAIAIDPTGGYMYVAGNDENTTSNNTEWRIEKRLLSDGSLVSTFGTNGAISEHISSASDTANAIAIDPTGGYMYVAGNDENTTSNNIEWRIEQRSLTTGALGYAVSEHISTYSDTATGLAINTSTGTMYAVGNDENAGTALMEWRIEARSMATGSLVTSFGTSGAISEHISTLNDSASTIAIDPTGGNMYVAGNDTNTTGNYYEWRLESRSLSTGTLNYGISEHISTLNDSASTIAIDPTGGNMYVAGYDENDSGNIQEWRIEKRSLSAGALVSGFGSAGGVSENISSNGAQAFSVALNTSTGDMYAVGSGGGLRIEARSMSSGAGITPTVTPTPLANQNTAITTPSGAFRLRLLLGISNGGLAVTGQYFQLMEAQLSSGSCSSSLSYSVVTSSTPIAFYTNSNISDGSVMVASTNDPTDGTNAVQTQDYLSSNTSFTNSASAINAGQDGEWDIALYNHAAASNTTWCFEVQKSNGVALDTYSQFPQLTTPTTSYTQSGYRWMDNVNQAAVASQYPISEVISANSDQAYKVAIDPTGGYMYAVGSDSNNTAAYEWRIEKRSLSTGALSYGISEPVSTLNAEANAIAIDPTGGYMYVAGYDNNTTGNYSEWRIEKRSLSTGALVTTYGTSGVVTEHISSGSDVARAIAIDPTGGYMYVAGYDQNTTSNYPEWRIEKRSLSTGALSYGVSEHISTSYDQAESIAIDPTGGNMYLAGYDSTSGSTLEWRVEERSLSTGALVSGFGTSGGVSESISGSGVGNDQANAIAIDPTGGYMYLAGSDEKTGTSATDEWRIEKRSLSTGALSYGVSEHISTSYDDAYQLAIDPTGGNMYIVGDDTAATGYYEWRIEKRSLSTGALVASFGTSGGISESISITGNDIGYGIAIDTGGGNMYMVGEDGNKTGNYSEWRIESRSLISGAMNTGSAVTQTPLLPIDTSDNQFHPGDIVRLRLLIGIDGSPIATSGQAFTLQEAPSNGSCSNSLNFVNVSSSTPVSFYAGNTNLTDGSAMSASSSDPTDGSNTIAPQDYLSSNTDFTNNQSGIAPTQDGEWDIALQVNQTNIGGYCFRAVQSGGTLLSSYDYFPSLGVHALPNQRLRLGKQLVNGTQSGLDLLHP